MSNRNAVSQSPIPLRLTDAVVTSAVPVRVLRLPEVIARVGLKRAAIYQHIAIGAFPKQVPLGVRAVGWLESEIDTWLLDRIGARSNHGASVRPG